MARSWGVEYSDLCVHSGVRSDVGGGSGDLAPYSDPDKPQHDRRPSGSLRDLGGAGFLPGTTLGPICGRRVSCYPNCADEPADSRLLYERNEGRVARYNRARLEHSRCEAGTIYVYGDAAYYRFFTGAVRPGLRLLEIREGDPTDLSREPASSCPILLWVVGSSWNADEIRARLGLSDNSFGIADFYEAFLVFRNPPYT
jgi:hypothetical protein